MTGSMTGRILLWISVCCVQMTLWSQRPYFQQRVDYVIRATLNDRENTLSAFGEIRYLNNSDQPLDFIYFHIWPNAYRDNSTALARQMLWQGKTSLYFSKPEERGYIDSLDFQVNGQPVKWEFDTQNPDICKVLLNEPLRAGDSLLITTPFFLKIPDAKFSRLGHTGQAYYMTQWYPKPAVFDNTGWHPMPYLDQGEFFSEFGSFDVSITLPDNYVLCATGDRVDARDEEEFLQRKAEETSQRIAGAGETPAAGSQEFPPSSLLWKTVRFKQSQVHDFAWFADKRFLVRKGEVELPHSKRLVDTWVYFTPGNIKYWKDALSYVNDATLFYSYHIGDYPYNHVTAVDGSIMAGGGMEYPNITVIGEASSAMDLDMVITHEVGHNWFYGILGSNERDHPFLDEGLNSFYELRYMRQKYPSQNLTAMIGLDSSLRVLGLNKMPYWKYHELPFYSATRKRKDQPLFLGSEAFTESNYGAMVYSKSALIFDYLLDYMGEHMIDSAMKTYYARYRFTHPTPGDLFKILNTFAGDELRHFQQALVYSPAKIDYKISALKKAGDGSYILKLKNKTGTILPFNIYTYDKDNRVLAVNWYNGFERKRTVVLPPSGEAHHFKIDGLEKMPDLYRKNNSIRAGGIFKKARPLKLGFVTRTEDPSKNYIYLLSATGMNAYNGGLAGPVIHNYGFYEKRVEYLLAPMYGFRTKTPTGFAELRLNLYPEKLISHMTLGVNARTFAYDRFETGTMNQRFGSDFSSMSLNYYKIAPYVRMELKKKNPVSLISQFLTLTSHNLFTDSLDARTYQAYALSGPLRKNRHSYVNEVLYELDHKRVIDPFDLRLSLQQAGDMTKLSATFRYRITLGPRHWIGLRLFAGTFLSGSAESRGYYAFRASGYNGWHDYLFEGNYLGRNERTGLGFSQFMEKDGALKVWTPLGQSSVWLTSLNITSPKFFRLPIKAFADVVLCDGSALNKDRFLWDAGLQLSLWTDILEVYLPLVYSDDIRRTHELNNVRFPNTIRFTFNIHKLALKTILQNSVF